MTLPQFYGIYCGEKTEGLNHAQLVELLNKRRKKKGLPPMTDGLPSCVLPKDWKPPRK
jgi:hypothetical protein